MVLKTLSFKCLDTYYHLVMIVSIDKTVRTVNEMQRRVVSITSEIFPKTSD